MARRPNKALRIFVPAASLLLGLGVVLAIVSNTKPRTVPSSGKQAQTTPAEQSTQQGETPKAAPQQSKAKEATTTSQPKASTPADASSPDADQSASGNPTMAAPVVGLHAQIFTDDPLTKDLDPLGELAFDSPYEMQVKFTHIGAGIASIRLSRELDSVQADRQARLGPVDEDRHVKVQGLLANANNILVPMAAADIAINGSRVSLTTSPDGQPIWRQVDANSPGHFEAFILDGNDKPIVRLERIYSLNKGSFDITLEQHAYNLTDAPMQVQWRQFGPVDLDSDTLGYGGEKRRVRFGYLLPPDADKTRQYVFADDFLWRRTKVITGKEFANGIIWPNTRSKAKHYELVWLGMTNRYFGAVLHPLVELSDPAPDKVFHAAQVVRRVLLSTGEMVLGIQGPETTVDPNKSLDVNVGMYAGPLSKESIEADPQAAAVGVDKIVVYNFGGPCAVCTFTWLTGPLLGLLHLLHTITHDWGLAIILLVVCVRTLLHPITRWSQIRMQIFGKQMQNMGPKQKAIQEKYKDDKQQLQKEMARLWKEEGISPTGMLGCLPMFLQSPIWIALYATLYFAIDLRHEPAFFGIFQTLTNNHWPFLADLAKPDRAIYFGPNGIKLPLMGNVTSLNVLPLLLGVVFYMQQKYLQPPTSTAMTPEQKSQQKMMKIMMVVMFPFIMYNAPSGLALYFITNSTLGILEGRWIRKHLEESGRLDPENLRKKPDKKGFFAKIKEMAEQQQQLKAQQGMSQKRMPKRVKNEAPTRKYKKKR